MTGDDWPLVGREAEMATLIQLVGGASSSVVLVGSAGVGKSRLVADCLCRLEQQGIHTVLVRATRSTATIPFGAFARWAPVRAGPSAIDRLQVLRAIAAALLDEELEGDVASGHGRVVIAVDDAHLLDEASAALVLYLAAHTTATVVATIRSGEACHDAVVALWKERLAQFVELRPLSEDQTIDLLQRVLGGPLGSTARHRLWTLTTGVPLYLREVLRSALEQGVLGGGSPDRWEWRWRGELAGSGRLAELMGDHLARLEPAERRVIEVVALGEPLPVRLVTELDPDGALVDAEQRGFVVVADESVGEPTVRLAHPLYGEVLRATVPALTAREHQRALASAASVTGWQETDPLRVACWWLDSNSAPASPEVYVAGARRALTLAEWELAERLGRAAEAAGAGADATLLRATALVQLGGWGKSEELLVELATDVLDDDQAAEQARLRAGSLAWVQGQPAAARDMLARAAVPLQGPVRAQLLVDAAYIAALICDPDGAAPQAVDAVNAAGARRDLRVQAMAIAALAWVLQGRLLAAVQAAEMVSPFLPMVGTIDPSPADPAALMLPAHALALAFMGRFEEATALTESAVGRPGDHEVEVTRPVWVTVAARVALLRGRLTMALEQAREAQADAEPGPTSQWPAAVAAMAAAQLGAIDIAQDVLDRVALSQPPIPLYTGELALARAWLAAARGDLADARAIVTDAAVHAATARAPIIELLALVELARLGAPDRAAPRLTELGGVVDGDYVQLVAAYARSAASGDGGLLDETSARFEAMGVTLLAAEAAATAAHAHLAGKHRRQHLESLARARMLASRSDGARTPALATLDADPVLATLTSREREVIELAGQGLSNRQIAGRLYVSIRTVNAHLSHAYAKLGTSDRRVLVKLVTVSSGSGSSS